MNPTHDPSDFTVRFELSLVRLFCRLSNVVGSFCGCFPVNTIGEGLRGSEKVGEGWRGLREGCRGAAEGLQEIGWRGSERVREGLERG